MKPPSSAVSDPSCTVGFGPRLPQMWGQWLGQGQVARTSLSPLQLEERRRCRRKMLIEILIPSLRDYSPFLSRFFSSLDVEEGWGGMRGRS